MAQKKHRVTIVNRREQRIVHKPIREAVAAALDLFSSDLAEVTIVISDSAELRELNQRFRQTDRTTDVLSFPAPEQVGSILGDVILNWDLAENQARTRQVRPVDEAAMLAVHGVLHLLGFDDHTESDRAAMRQAMNAAIRAAGLPEESEWESVPYPEEHVG